MLSILNSLRLHVNVLTHAADAPAGKKPRGGKTERLKAIVAINNAIAKKSTQQALSAASRMEMVCGPQEDKADIDPPLGWAELAIVVLETLDVACNDALSSRSASRSGIATMKPEYMTCFRNVLKLSLSQGPSTVIRSIVPACLYFAHQWLSEPALRSLLADQIWQCVRDLLIDDANRAMLTPPYIRTWVDVCVEQLTGRGPLHHQSNIATKLAADVLQTVAKGVDNYDILTQSTKSVAPSKMLGGDFGYAIICERCCLMLVISESMPRREARELQATAFKTLTIVLSNHCMDVVASSALKSVVHASLKPIGMCWYDRSVRDSALSLARMLLLLAPYNSKLLEVCRSKVLADMRDDSSSTVVRAGNEVSDDFVDIAAISVSLRECLEFARASQAARGHVIVWLRVAFAILSKRILKKGFSIVADAAEVFEQCTMTAETVIAIFRNQIQVRDSQYTDIVKWASKVINVAATCANRICSTLHLVPPSPLQAWQTLYRVLKEQLSKERYSMKSRLMPSTLSGEVVQPEQMLLATLSLLCRLEIISEQTLNVATHSSRMHEEVPYPLSRFLSVGEAASALEVEYLRNLIARGAASVIETGYLRPRFITSLVHFCESSAASQPATKLLRDAACATMGLVRGECSASADQSSKSQSCAVSSGAFDQQVLDPFWQYLRHTASEEKITEEGKQLVEKTGHQAFIWPSSYYSDNYAEEPMQVATPSSTTGKHSSSNSFSVRSSRHSSVDSHVTESMENQIKSKLCRLAVQSSILSESEVELSDDYQGHILPEHQQATKRSSARGFSVDSACVTGSKMIIFIASYLREGIATGLIPVSSSYDVPKPLGELVSLLTTIIQRFAETDVRMLLLCKELCAGVVDTSTSLVRLLERNLASFKGTKPDQEYLWNSLLRQLQNSLSATISICSKFFFEALTLRMRDNREVVQQFSSGYLVDIDSKQPFTKKGKRKTHESRTRRVAKRQKTESSSSREESPSNSVQNVRYRSRKGGFSDDEDVSDSGSEASDMDNFGDDMFGKGSLKSSGVVAQGNPTQSRSSLPHVKDAVELVVLSSWQNPFVKEIVCDKYVKGLDRLDEIEHVLSPDGFERSALISNLVDAGFLELRQCIWTILLSIGTPEAVRRVAQDLNNVGAHLKELEGVAHNYVSFYVTSLPLHPQNRSQSRKSYPMPHALENIRMVFLQFATRVLDYFRGSEMNNLTGSDDMWLQGNQSRSLYLINSLITVSEHFRTAHALRMPRRARIAYLRFGVAAIELVSEKLECRGQLHESQSDLPNSLQGAVDSIQSALRKFLADCEAVVRISAARVVTRFIATQSEPLVKTEIVIQDALPQTKACRDSTSFYGCESAQSREAEVDESLLEMQFNLSAKEQGRFSSIHESFRNLGSRAKAYTALLVLVEIAINREDLLPFCLIQVFNRVMKGAGGSVASYHFIARLCVALEHSSPRRLYQAFSRAILSKWFKANGIEGIREFPAQLVVDKAHGEESIRYDWMRNEQAALLPYIIVRDNTSLDGVKHFAELLGLTLRELLSQNASSLAVVIPMQFLDGGLHERGVSLWKAIDEAVNGQAKQLLFENKAAVIRGLLRSIACGLESLNQWNSRAFDIAKVPGFSRDAKEVQPPLYDPLVVALAINALFEQSPEIEILPRNALQGALFAEVRDFQSGGTVGEAFKGFLEDCNKGKISILGLLLTISSFMDGPPKPQCRQNHLDSYFSVGLLWRMLGVNMLIKTSSERVMFYRLVMKGFSSIETVHDAAWLLQDVQRKVVTLHDSCPEVNVGFVDLCMDSSKRDFLFCMATPRERQMYELLSIVSPALVSVLAAQNTSEESTVISSIAGAALNNILQLCNDKCLWTVILCNGPFPAMKSLLKAKRYYQSARETVESKSSRDPYDAILASLNRFQGIQRLENGSHSSMLVLACLQELKELLTEPGVKALRRRMKEEGWVRSDGRSALTAPRIEKSIVSIIGLVYETLGKLHSGRQVVPTGFTRLSRPSKRIRDVVVRTEIMQEIANVLGVLGLVHPQSQVFVSSSNREMSIPPFAQKERYQDVQSGIEMSFKILLEIIHGTCPIAADYALNTMIELLRSDDGKKAYSRAKLELEVIAPFRTAARKLTVTNHPAKDYIPCDPFNGDLIDTTTLPGFLDPELWNMNQMTRGSAEHSAEWMRRLSYVLARQCNSASLNRLSTVCYISMKLSCRLFPYILMDIVDSIDEENLRELSALITQSILTNIDTPADVLRTFVHSLDVLTQIGLYQLVRRGISYLRNDRGKPKLPSVYVLDIPYLLAARAAMRCGSYFSAIRFAQMHVDRQTNEAEAQVSSKGSRSRGDRRYSSCPSRDANVEIAERTARMEVKEVLKEAMMQINESDGVRAFGYDDSLPTSSAGLAELDMKWSKSLSAWDIVSRNSDHERRREQPSVMNAHGLEVVLHQGVNLQRELSVLTSFLGFGTLSIAEDYWHGLLARVARTGTSGEDASAVDALSKQRLNDLRYAMAWKLGRWESPSLLPVVNNPSRNEMSGQPGFHEAVYGIMRSFRTQRYDEIPKVLARARSTQLRELVGDTSGVSTKKVFQTSARLHVFNIFEDALRSLSPETADFMSGYIPMSSSDEHVPISSKSHKESSAISKYAASFVEEAPALQLATPHEPIDTVLKRILGSYYGMNEDECCDAESSLFRGVSDAGIFAEDLPVSLARCLSAQTEIARAAATVSFQLLANNKNGQWARSTSSLGTKASSHVKEASALDQIAWKLQEARLRWSACDDAPFKKQALSAINDIISKDLNGTLEQSSRSNGSIGSQSSGFSWGSSNGNEQLALLRSEACNIAASWCLDMKSDEPMNIFDMYLVSGLKAAESSQEAKRLVGRAHFVMASFADSQLTRINAYRKSHKYDQMVRVIRQEEEKVEKLKAMKDERKEKLRSTSKRSRMRSSRSQATSGAVTESQIGKDLELLIKNKEKRVNEDKTRLARLNRTYQRWQTLACKHFAASLLHGSAHDLRAAFRMVAIWLDSGSMRDPITMALVSAKEKDRSIESLSSTKGINVPSAKLLPLAPQLSSRLSSSPDIMPTLFQRILANTIHEMAGEFPSHCLWQLLALSNLTRTSANSERYHSLYRGDKSKKEAADEILGRLQSQHGETFEDIKRVADAYIALSEIPNHQKRTNTLDMSGTQLGRLGELKRVHVPTVPLPLSGTDYFGSIPTMVGFDRRATVCAGLSKPLKVVCYGSDGKKYPQIVKGKDDLRGDAVMEQIFSILNSLLEKDAEASKRNLLVRTYRIIPLSPFSGIMQFVSNTRQFRDLLVGSNSTKRSLHERYRPQDMKHEQVQTKAFDYRKDIPRRMQYLKSVWQQFQPVFRYFFLEEWPDPAEWFSHQLAYSRSVAVMSIVGFILGLGDRHLSNILFDIFTGEVVHIDFGIAFEQGKCLPTPELMPFRLTRDIVDGFGISGVEGAFRRCSEVTLEVMRKSKDVLLTVAEVLLHDPMFNWDLTPEEVLREQLEMKGERDMLDSDGMSRSIDESAAADAVVDAVDNDMHGSKDAQRALHRISEKLDGLEGTERLSVEAHVARLVDEAQAFHVIAAVYPGWAPWL